MLFMPINRQSIWRDLLVIQVGFAMFAFAIAIVIRANLLFFCASQLAGVLW